jgi:hypothetical protein
MLARDEVWGIATFKVMLYQADVSCSGRKGHEKKNKDKTCKGCWGVDAQLELGLSGLGASPNLRQWQPWRRQ